MYALQAVPAALDHLILKALAKRPEHRFPSAEGMSFALAPFGLAPEGARRLLASPGIPRTPHVTPLPKSAFTLDSAEIRTLAVLTLASTVVFSALAALFLRLLEAR